MNLSIKEGSLLTQIKLSNLRKFDSNAQKADNILN